MTIVKPACRHAPGKLPSCIAVDGRIHRSPHPALRTGGMERRRPAIKGVGGAPLYLIDGVEDETSVYDFEFLPDIDRPPHEVHRGHMAFRGAFYERIFGLRELRFLDDEGEYT